MFFAGTGEIPEIFINKMIPQDWYLIFDMKNNFHKAFLLEIIVSARGNGRLKDLPGWQLAYSLAKEYPGKDSEIIGFIKRAYRKLRGR